LNVDSGQSGSLHTPGKLLRSAVIGLAIVSGLAGGAAAAQEATPGLTCMTVATPGAMPGADQMSGDHDMHHGEEASFDQLYIDMMVPHHEAVIALAEAALPTLTDPDLIAIAENVVATQSDENVQLREWREAWFGDATPMMDDATMMQMLEAMPVGSMDDMMLQMDPMGQVMAYCAAGDADRAFAEQVLAHHQMAVDASEIAVEQAEHPELVAFAEGVIVDQQAEIEVLTAFLATADRLPWVGA
jgi:uncharacterized protein (DUF305 family)